MYALSTCVWCNRTKKFLKDHNIEFEYVDVDQCSPEDREKIRTDVKNKGGLLLYPVTIIGDKNIINGFREDQLKEALGIR